MENVALYLRKSREDEELKEETLVRHETMLRDYCARRSLHIVKVYKEVVSGENIANRPEMQKLLDDVSAGSFDGVVCVEIERLSRGNAIDQVEVLDAFKGSGTKIYTLNKVYDLSKEEIDEEYFEFALFMSRREYKTITRRMQRGRLQATKEGYYIGSTIPFGYDTQKYDKGHILVPNDQIDVVKYIFNEYLSGKTCYKISCNLNARGIKTTKGCRWFPESVTSVLKNQVYIGMIHSTKLDMWVKGKHEPVIDQETFERAQALRLAKAPRLRTNEVLKNPLSGIVRCGYCGRLLQRHCTQSREYLGCTRISSCSGKRFYRLDKMEDQLLNELKKELKGFNYFLDNSTNEIKSKKAKLETELTILKKELNTKEKQVEKACEMLEKGIYDIDLYKKRTDALDIDIKTLKDRIKELEETPIEDDQRAKKAIPILEKVLEKYPALNIEQKNKLLRSIIKDIVVNDKNGDMELKITLLI